MYVIVDWHMVGATSAVDKNPLTYVKESIEFFSYISELYKDQEFRHLAISAAYELSEGVFKNHYESYVNSFLKIGEEAFALPSSEYITALFDGSVSVPSALTFLFLNIRPSPTISTVILDN